MVLQSRKRTSTLYIKSPDFSSFEGCIVVLLSASVFISQDTLTFILVCLGKVESQL